MLCTTNVSVLFVFAGLWVLVCQLWLVVMKNCWVEQEVLGGARGVGWDKCRVGQVLGGARGVGWDKCRVGQVSGGTSVGWGEECWEGLVYASQQLLIYRGTSF